LRISSSRSVTIWTLRIGSSSRDFGLEDLDESTLPPVHRQSNP
jgi:hypothetical protein